MNHLKPLRKYFWKYRLRLLLGISFIVISNYLAILTPQITGFVFHLVEKQFNKNAVLTTKGYDTLTVKPLIKWMEESGFNTIMLCGLTLLVLALLRGVFMFFMRQTIIVMSRHIEYDQKNEIFTHYQQLDQGFYKNFSTGDLMNRIAEDVSRVRMYAGPAIMYLVNLTALIGFALYFMFRSSPELTLYCLSPLPVLAVFIYWVNTVIHRKSERIQSLLGDLTTHAQEAYSGIRVIRSFVQEKAMLNFFNAKSEEYRNNAISLSKVEGVYFPSITLLIGLSTLFTILFGGLQSLKPGSGIGINTIVEFVMYVNMLTFPVSAIGWTASMVQRAAASQKRINEFLLTKPKVSSPEHPKALSLKGNLSFNAVSFTYPNTGITALKEVSLAIKNGDKVAIIGKTGSGKTTLAHLLLRFYDPDTGTVEVEGVNLKDISIKQLRCGIAYVPQDHFLFSDSIANNIAFGSAGVTHHTIRQSAQLGGILNEIEQFPDQFETLVGERGVMLSGGQKQRISIARALIKNANMIILDDCLSAVDVRTENDILSNLTPYLQNKTAIIITHRIFSLFEFDQILVMDNGRIVEQGTHKSLLELNGFYSELYKRQQQADLQGLHI